MVGLTTLPPRRTQHNDICIECVSMAAASSSKSRQKIKKAHIDTSFHPIRSGRSIRILRQTNLLSLISFACQATRDCVCLRTTHNFVKRFLRSKKIRPNSSGSILVTVSYLTAGASSPPILICERSILCFVTGMVSPPDKPFSIAGEGRNTCGI